jgi:hypothetical protein
MLEEHILDLLPGYALGCLDEDELLKVSRHLPFCAACRGELSGYWSVADQLALAAAPRTPSLDLKAKILQRVGSTTPVVESRPAAPRHSTSAPHSVRGLAGIFQSMWARPVRLALGALVLLLVIFLGASNFLLWQRVNDLQARVPQGNMQLVHLEGTTNAPQARGYLMVFNKETYGTLVVENVPSLEPGYQYQLWLIRDGKRTNGGVFSVSSDGYGTLEVAAGHPLETYPAFGITIEPAGGSPAPTGKKVLGGNF